MNEEKKLDEKKLEDVSGGELLDAAQRGGAQRSGTCGDCANYGTSLCPYMNNPTIQMKKLTGAEGCSAFAPRA